MPMEVAAGACGARGSGSALGGWWASYAISLSKKRQWTRLCRWRHRKWSRARHLCPGWQDSRLSVLTFL